MAGSRSGLGAAAVAGKTPAGEKEEQQQNERKHGGEEESAGGAQETEEEEGEGAGSRRKLLQRQRAELRALAAEWKQSVRRAKTRSERRSAEEAFSKREASLLQQHREELEQQQKAEQQQQQAAQDEDTTTGDGQQQKKQQNHQQGLQGPCAGKETAARKEEEATAAAAGTVTAAAAAAAFAVPAAAAAAPAPPTRRLLLGGLRGLDLLFSSAESVGILLPFAAGAFPFAAAVCSPCCCYHPPCGLPPQAGATPACSCWCVVWCRSETAAAEAMMQRAFASLSFYNRGGEEGAARPPAAPTRAQKRREKKRAAEAARELELQKELENCPMLGRIEWEQLSSALSRQRLQIHFVAADGHCLYRAVCHQVATSAACPEAAAAAEVPAAAAPAADGDGDRSMASPTSAPQQQQGQDDAAGEGAKWNVETLRARVADFLLTQREQFSPFLGEAGHTEAGFVEYCEKIRSTAEWGGELELQLIASLLRRPIEVSSIRNGEYSKLVYGEEFSNNDTAPLRLTYHRHLLAAGGHYNSTSALEKDETVL